MWAGLVPPWSVDQARAELRRAREQTAALRADDPGAPAVAARSAAAAAAALRVVLLGSGRTTYEAMHADDRTYVAYDMNRRLQLLAESVREPRTWPGVTSRALWVGQVAEWSGFDVGPEPVEGDASLAPLLADLRFLRPLPGGDPSGPARRLVERVLVGVVQYALSWAVPAADLLLSPVGPGEPDLRRRTGRESEPTWAARLAAVVAADPVLPPSYHDLGQAEQDLIDELGPTRRAGGHMDVRPDEAVLRGLEWRAAVAVGAIAARGRQLLLRAAPPPPGAADAWDLLTAVGPGNAWSDEGVRAQRGLVDLALVLTVGASEPAADVRTV